VPYLDSGHGPISVGSLIAFEAKRHEFGLVSVPFLESCAQLGREAECWIECCVTYHDGVTQGPSTEQASTNNAHICAVLSVFEGLERDGLICGAKRAG
jgi:hypothetical protein